MFVKLGDLVLNTDHIVSIEDDGDDLYVFTVASTARAVEAQPYYLIPSGAKATALRAWLAHISVNLLDGSGSARQERDTREYGVAVEDDAGYQHAGGTGRQP